LSARPSHLTSTASFVCPDCKGSLQDLRCSTCNVEFVTAGGIPNLLSRQPQFASAMRISAVYDDIYTNHENVWEDQGRPPEFIRYFADVVAGLGTGRILEVGCGEGILLAALQGTHKSAIDISARALRKTQERTGADGAVAIAERLPFADASFDVVVSVGVMEHYIDENAATTEIARVLAPGGHYVVLLHTAMTGTQSINQKVREFIFPRPRPIALAKWLIKKLYHPIHQPVQNRYTVDSARACLLRNGFTVKREITLRDRPEPPLGGPHVVLFVARKT